MAVPVLGGKFSPRSAASAGKGRAASASPSPGSRVSVSPSVRKSSERKAPSYHKYRPPHLRVEQAPLPAPTPTPRQTTAPTPRQTTSPTPRLVPAPTPRTSSPGGSSSAAQRNPTTPRSRFSPTASPAGSSSAAQRTPTTALKPPMPESPSTRGKDTKSSTRRVPIQRPPSTLAARPCLPCLSAPPFSPPLTPPMDKTGKAGLVVEKKGSRRKTLAERVVPYLDAVEDISCLNLQVPPPIPIDQNRAKKMATKKHPAKTVIDVYRTQKYNLFKEEDDDLYV